MRRFVFGRFIKLAERKIVPRPSLFSTTPANTTNANTNTTMPAAATTSTVLPVDPMANQTCDVSSTASANTKTTATTTTTTKTEDDFDNTKVAVIAHRGGADEGPENTLGALRQALLNGADGVEFDLQRTSDGYLVVLHDDTLERTAAPYSNDVADNTGLSRKEYRRLIQTPVNDLTLKQVQMVDIGSFFGASWANERVALFEDALQLLKEFPKCKIFAELKSGDFKSADLAADTLARLKPNVEQLVIIGFSFDLMAYTKKLISPDYKVLWVMHPRIPILQSVANYKAKIVKALEQLDGVDPCALSTSITREYAEAVREVEEKQGRRKLFATWVWKKFPGTDTEKNWQYLVDSGVNAITTDKPSSCAQFLNKTPPVELPPATVDDEAVDVPLI